MLKGVAWGITLTIAIALISVYALLHSGMIPANADTKPGGLELWMAGTSLDATLDRYAPKERNPVALTDQNLLEGVRLFRENCAVCHGSAKGTNSPSPIAKGEYPRPPQLATDGVEDDPEGHSFWKIKHGIRLTGMPSFGYTLKDEQIWTLALFLKHMDKLPPVVQKTWLKVRNWPVTPPGQTGQK
ncbi:MAG: Cytochrome C class I protein [Candidatus Gallionella acididurans]|uniref:Cytochrome C class I protein n=1 Tax=Candidatus Gallionella acididurans TaxID=1796491 RepID=A0A139BQB9_9PROT|nr:MAG: Cytochrome C class I protein [Candidatus Gallionella acididurans]